MTLVVSTVVALGTVAVLGGFIFFLVTFRREGGFETLHQELRTRLKARIGNVDTITADQLGVIEEHIKDLKEVIVVAHKVEDPEETLRAAVQDNFQEGVQYKFIVSRSQYLSASDSYTDFFKAIFVISQRIPLTDGSHSKIKTKSFEDVFSIHALNGEWGSWPYVFYRFNGVDGSPLKMVAFRGDQIKEGIAENYVELSAVDAQSIYNACQMAMSEAGQMDIATSEPIEFDDAATVLSHGTVVPLRRRG